MKTTQTVYWMNRLAVTIIAGGFCLCARARARSSKLVRFVSVLCLAVWAVAPRAAAQAPAGLDLHLYAGLTIAGAIGTVYSVEYVTDLAQTNTPSAWRCLEYLQLPASPYLWADKSAPATA